MRTLTNSLPFLLLLLLPVTSCGGVDTHDDDGADGDADADSDTDADSDGDSDGDGDADGDGDSDGDGDGDADGDGDGDGDADGDGPCDLISCDDTRSCTTDACQVINGLAECSHVAEAGSCGRGSVCCVPSDLSCDPVDGTGCVCDSDGVGCGTCGDFDHDGEVNYGDWEVTCTGADLPTLVTCCDFYEYDIDHDGDFDETDCETFWGRVLDPDIDDVCNPPGN